MDFVRFVESDVIVQHSIKCCGCNAVVHAHPPNDLQGFLADLEMSWTLSADDKPMPLCRKCGERAKGTR